jgi:hypothetical protein
MQRHLGHHTTGGDTIDRADNHRGRHLHDLPALHGHNCHDVVVGILVIQCL